MSRKDERIIESLLDNAKGEFCGRYIMALEDALHALRDGSEHHTIRLQNKRKVHYEWRGRKYTRTTLPKKLTIDKKTKKVRLKKTKK